MKRTFTLLACAFLLSGLFTANHALAQTDSAATEPAEPQRFTYGGMLNIYSGVTYGSFGKLKSDLQGTNTFNNKDFKIKGLGTVYGAQIWGIAFKRLMIGVGGTAMSYDASLSISDPGKDSTAYRNNFANLNRGEATVKTMMVQANLGFAILNRSHALVFPYIGYMSGSSTLKVKNYSPSIMQVGTSSNIQAARSSEYNATIGQLEIGIGGRFHKRPHGGVLLGADLGGYFNVKKGTWKDSDGNQITGLKQATLGGVYLRITVGLGVFNTLHHIQHYNHRVLQNDGNEGTTEPRRTRRQRRDENTETPAPSGGQ